MINFQWRGSTDEEKGLAIYTSKESTYELWLPNFKKASQLNQVLNDVYKEGRIKGHIEMILTTTDAMNKVARGL